jgi:DNA-binding NarL/FixJ family response regulator
MSGKDLGPCEAAAPDLRQLFDPCGSGHDTAGVRCSPLVQGGAVFGRDGELAAVERFLEGVSSGPSALVLKGSAGIGKTTLWQAATQRAAARRFTILACRAAESEAKLALAALADLLAELRDDLLVRLPAPQRRALEVALLRRDAHGPPRDPRALATAVRSVLVELAGRAPLLVAVDDLQWLDAPSARMLDFAVRRLGTAPVGILATSRAGDPRADRLHLERALPDDRVVRVRVGPLSVAALHQVIGAKLGQALPRPVLVRVAQAAEGNPLFAVEIARVLLEGGVPLPGQPLPVPGDVKALVARRARALPALTREVLLVAAALPQARVQLVAAVLGRPPGADLEPAERAGMVELDRGVIRFAHPLFAAAIYASASIERRRRLHRRLAAGVDDAEQKARHLALAAEGPDEGVAAALERAARAVSRRGAATAAAELAEQACQLTPPRAAARIRARAMLAAECHLVAGDLGRGRVLLEEVVAATPPGTARAHALVLLGQVHYRQGSFPDAVGLFARARQEAADDRRLHGLVEVELGHALLSVGEVEGAAARAARALELLEEHGPPVVLADALAFSVTLDVLQGRRLDDGKLARALALEDPDRAVVVVSRPSFQAGFCMLCVGRIAEARMRLRALRERLLERGQDGDQGPGIYLAWIECLRGDLVAAQAYAREAYEAAVGLGSGWFRGLGLAFCALVDAYRGNAEAVRTEAAEALVLLRQGGWTLRESWALWAVGLLELSLGNPAATARALEPLAQRVEAAGKVAMTRSAFLPDEIEALVALGELQRAERLLEILDAYGRSSGLAWPLATAARCRGLLLAAEGEIGGALRALEEALTHQASLEMPLELARTLLVCGQIQRRQKRKRAARDSLVQALDLFERSGAALWAKRAREELGRVGVRPRAPQDLTAAERRVAELAAGGLTNQEVAAAAFLSPKTVEANLTRIYRKLGIRSRAELGVRLAERSGAPGGQRSGV